MSQAYVLHRTQHQSKGLAGKVNLSGLVIIHVKVNNMAIRRGEYLSKNHFKSRYNLLKYMVKQQCNQIKICVYIDTSLTRSLTTETPRQPTAFQTKYDFLSFKRLQVSITNLEKSKDQLNKHHYKFTREDSLGKKDM